MERLAGSSAATTSYQGFVSWEEVFVSSEKGRREVHYFLKNRSGGSDLAVIGKEKSLRHMSYRYALRDPSLGPYWKLKSRREVIGWLDSIVSDDVSHVADATMAGEHGCGSETENLKYNQFRTLSLFSKEFTWLGPPWTCRKRRNHYQSFKRNGFQISVHDFVYILAEENNRLVAYLEDLYEDSRGNKMVVVRWFHKIDEVGIVLPHSFSEREVFFSNYLQDLSIECIDGLACVLSPQHYKKFQNEAHHTHLEPFMCEHQFEDDDVKPYDITQIKGYWKQEILRCMYSLSASKSNGSSGPSKSNGRSGQSDDSSELEENLQCTTGLRPKKRQRYTKIDEKEAVDAANLLENLSTSKINMTISTGDNCIKMVGPTTLTTIKETNDDTSQYLVVGSEVEVLCQDSGIRGCWFRASVIKKHKDKVKVQYQDIQDAVDESKKLEEWVPASRIAMPDDLGLRMHGRTKIRPAPESNKYKISLIGGIGSIVDAWWHDGWWEGIVVKKESEANYHVYFPGEKVMSTFGPGKLRHSQDWSENGWVNMKERPDLVTSILSSLKTKQESSKSYDSKSTIASGDGIQSKQSDTCLDSKMDKPRISEVVLDLLKNDLFPHLRWKSSKKRSRGNSSCQKTPCNDSNRKKSPKVVESYSSDSSVIQASSKVDHEDYNYGGDPSIFSTSVVPSLTNLVMCR
ncbi:unnamed protein product [Lupinus luteus]|uniref:BAH domain-containing protein n=1 Tax=Lupinus luteus TaxID=3873 RepID=A0AAV1X2I7_LUPLU